MGQLGLATTLRFVANQLPLSLGINMDVDISLNAIYSRNDLLGLMLESGEDIAQCFKQVRENDSQFWRRTLYRTSFSHFEGIMNGLKQVIYHTAPEAGLTLNPEVKLFLLDATPSLKNNGQVTTKKYFFSFEQTLKSIVYTYIELFSPKFKINYSGNEWQQFKNAILTRNRLTHPRTDDDLIISDKELEYIKNSTEWFSSIFINILKHHEV